MGILEAAAKLTSEDRQKVYGHPADDFAKVAQMTEPILKSNIDSRLKHALYMAQVKIARLLNTPDHMDSVIDLAGYANTYAMVLKRIKTEKKTKDETTGTG
jgi:hypothetical protein